MRAPWTREVGMVVWTASLAISESDLENLVINSGDNELPVILTPNHVLEGLHQFLQAL